MENSIITKKKLLFDFISQYEKMAIAFSGGVDSSFLLAFAKSILKERVIAITAVSTIHPERERSDAVAFAKELNIKHLLVETDEMEMDSFLENPQTRCYVCKKHMFESILARANSLNISTVAHGLLVDDLRDYRPGIKAAKEMGVLSPMSDVGMTKDDIRGLSKEMGLLTWNKPAMACLASRIPYGVRITEKALGMVERAEGCLLDLGFSMCRVRHHGTLARIEIDPSEFSKLLKSATRQTVLEQFKSIGFDYISLDLKGYVTGSLNAVLKSRPD